MSIDVDPVKRRFLTNRYWVGTGNEAPPRTVYRPPPAGSSFRRPITRQSGKITTASVLGIAAKMMTEEQPGGSKPVEATGFKAYTSILQSMSAPPEPTNPNKNFRKPHNVSKKAGQLENRPDNQLSKLERVQKYLAKAQRVELAKKRTKKQQQQQEAKRVTTISLDSSSESEDDDVIEIPVPPPPLVCLDDSSDDSMQAPPTTMTTTPQQLRTTAPARGSRCTSPSSSIVSDDFIAPLDRNCLSDSMDSVNMTEEDLRAAGKARSSVAQTLDKKRDTNKGGSRKQATTPATSTPSTSNSCSSSASAKSSVNPSTPTNCKAARTRIPLLYKNLIGSKRDVTIAHYHEDATHADDVVLVSADFEEATSIVETVVAVPIVAVPTTPLRSILKKPRSRSTSTGDSVYAKGATSVKAKRGQKEQVDTDKSQVSSDSEQDEGVAQAVVAEKPSKSSGAKAVSSSSSTAVINPVTGSTSTTTTTTPVIHPTKSRVATVKKRKSITEEVSSHSESEPVGVSYIHSGEAVSNAQNSPKRKEASTAAAGSVVVSGVAVVGKKRQRLSTLTKTPESDNAFMSMISTIAQGGDVSDSDSVEMLPSTIEEITICSSEETTESNTGRQGKGSAMQFNEFPHEHVLKLVPIERKEIPNEWFISDADKIGPLPTPRVRCLNCHEMGHVRAKCRQKYKPPVCYMCGETGHLEPRCRKTLCLMVSGRKDVFLIQRKLFW